MELAERSLAACCQDCHRKKNTPQWETPLTTQLPRIYRVYLIRVARSTGLPVGDFEGRATSHTNHRVHFMHYQVRDTLVILEKVLIFPQYQLRTRTHHWSGSRTGKTGTGGIDRLIVV